VMLQPMLIPLMQSPPPESDKLEKPSKHSSKKKSHKNSRKQLMRSKES
jgi:hypothetical protein